MDLELMINSFPKLLSAAVITLKLLSVSLIIGLFIGLFFGIFKGYVVSVCIFSILNWFYPYQNWGISAEDAVSFNLIKEGSVMLIEEFPSSEDFIDTKEKIEKF